MWETGETAVGVNLTAAVSLEKEVRALDAKVGFILYLMPKCQVKINV